MTLISTATGLLFPQPLLIGSYTNGGTMDAATEKYAMIGRLYVDGRPAGAKTLSSGTIQFRTSACTWANGSTKLDVGIQGVATATGLIVQPNGTYSVKTTLTGGDGGIAANSWRTATMNSGTVNLTHGDLIAVVWDMTAKGGADTVLVTANNQVTTVGMTNSLPNCNAYVASAWQTTQAVGAGRSPCVIIVFDDGTLGWLDGTVPFNVVGTESFNSSTNPEERGMKFQVPWDCEIDALWGWLGPTDAASDFTYNLWSAPLTSPSALVTQAVLAEQMGGGGNSGYWSHQLASKISLSRDTDYAVTMIATGSSNTRLVYGAFGNTAHRATLPGSTTLAKVTRHGGSGVFTAENPAITILDLGIRICSFDNGSGSGTFPVLGGPFT